MKAILEILPIIEQAKIFGFCQLSNGTQLIGRVPHVAPEAWFHLLFPPLAEKDITLLEERLGREVPDSYKVFLTTFGNGLSIFSESLSLDGLRRNYIRKGDEARQPFAIEILNVDERPRDASQNAFFIGGYGDDGSLLYCDGQKVFRCSRESVEPLNRWDSLNEMLISEVTRLSSLFDEKGQRKDPDIPTTPDKVTN